MTPTVLGSGHDFVGRHHVRGPSCDLTYRSVHSSGRRPTRLYGKKHHFWMLITILTNHDHDQFHIQSVWGLFWSINIIIYCYLFKGSLRSTCSNARSSKTDPSWSLRSLVSLQFALPRRFWRILCSRWSSRSPLRNHITWYARKNAVNIVNSEHVMEYTRYLKYLRQDAWKTKFDNYS